MNTNNYYNFSINFWKDIDKIIYLEELKNIFRDFSYHDEIYEIRYSNSKNAEFFASIKQILIYLMNKENNGKFLINYDNNGKNTYEVMTLEEFIELI